MQTVPPSCPQCRGSGQIFIWLERPHGAERLHFWRLYLSLGYLRVPCGLCGTRGTLYVEPMPSEDWTRWRHRVPPEALRGS